MSIDSRYEKNNTSGGGVGFIGLLQIVFIVLKLCHIIDWTWLWVLSPIWITPIVFILLIIIGYLIALLKDRRIK